MATITGTSGSDLLSGTQFNDFIDGAGGIDTINAGAGDDAVRIAIAPTEKTLPLSMIDGGAGHDILDLVDLPGAARINIQGDGTVLVGTVGMVGGVAVFTPVAQTTGFEEIHLGAGGSTVSIDLGAVNQATPFLGWKIIGNSGRDVINDGRGSDTIDAGSGDDNVTFHGGNDIVELRDGTNFYTVSGLAGFSGQAQVDGGADTDSLIWNQDSIFGNITVDLAAGRAQSGAVVTLLSNFDNVFVGGFTGERLPNPIPGWHADVAGDDGNNILHVNIPDAGVAIVSARGGNDDIAAVGSGGATLIAYGGAGNDGVFGTDGADWINGGGHAPGDTHSSDLVNDGSDTLMGFGGNDHIFGNAQNAAQGESDGGDSIDAGSGSDYVNGNAGNDTIFGGDGSDRLFGGAGDDIITGDNDADILSGHAAPGNDHLNGNKGNDTLLGGFGNDDLHGGQGDDLLRGGEQDDVLSGDIGNDTLDGGGGVDTLIGGAGADFFVFPNFNVGHLPFVPVGGTRVDEIVDFEHGPDAIVLGFHVSALVFGGSASGFVEAAHVADILLHDVSHEGQVAAVQIGADTYIFYASDGGTGAIDSAFRLDGIHADALGASDFL